MHSSNHYSAILMVFILLGRGISVLKECTPSTIRQQISGESALPRVNQHGRGPSFSEVVIVENIPSGDLNVVTGEMEGIRGNESLDTVMEFQEELEHPVINL